MVEVGVERLDRGGRPATVILGQGHEHPAHRGRPRPGAVEDVLAGVDHLLVAGERPIHLAVTHPALVGAGQVVVVGHIEIDAPAPAPTVELGDDPPLGPLRILQAPLERRPRRDIPVAGVRAVVLEHREAGRLVELSQRLEVGEAPGTRQNRRLAEGRRLPRRRDHVVAAPHAPAGQERIAAKIDALGSRMGRKIPPLVEVGGILVFGVEARAEGEDHHFKAHLGGLVDRGPHELGLGGQEMVHERVFSDPGGE